jgi:peroxisomal membrane protein 2
MVDSIVERSCVAEHVVVTILDPPPPTTTGVFDSTNADVAVKYSPAVVRHLSIDENSPLLPSSSKAAAAPENRKSVWGRLWITYQSWLYSRPLLTKSLTAAIIVGCGDLAGQCIELIRQSPTTSLDLWKIFTFTLMGLLLQAPVTHYYYLVLDGKLPPTPSPWTMTTLLKLLIDQLLFAPTFTLLVFVFLGLFEGESPSQMADHLQREYWITMVANWKLWVPAVFCNLAFCPPELRVLYCNVIFFVWSIILSLLMSDAPAPQSTIDPV